MRRAVVLLAWSSVGIAFCLTVVAQVLQSYAAFDGFVLVIPLLPLSFAVVGALIAQHHPSNVVGWFLCNFGVGVSFGIFSTSYAQYPHLPAAIWLDWIEEWSYVVPLFSLITLLPLLFPDGRLPAARWRWVVWFAGTGMVLLILKGAFSPGPLSDSGFHNPLGISSAATLLDYFYTAGLLCIGGSALGAVAASVERFRCSQSKQRQQQKWFVAGITVLALTIVVMTIVWSGGNSRAAQVILQLGAPVLPISIGIAILRHGLYDIDLLINKTLVYGTLTGTLALCYFGGIVLLQQFFRLLTGQESQFAIVVSTLAIAALFNPLRQRIQDFIDRRFYRRKYDAQKTLAAFSASLRGSASADLEHLTGDLVRVIEETVQPSSLSIWLREESSAVKAWDEGQAAKV